MLKWKKTGRFSAESTEGHKLYKALPHSKEPIYNLFSKAGKYLGSTADKAEINQILEKQ